MTDPAERLLTEALHRRADHASYDVTGVGDVASTARGIRRRQLRNRTVLAAAAVLVVTVPTAVFVRGHGASPAPGPTHPVPSSIDLRDLARGPAPRISYVEGHDFIGTDGSRHALPIAGGITAITPYHGGFLVADDHTVGASVGLHQYDGQGHEIASSCTTGSPVLSPDQLDAVWVRFPCSEATGSPSSVVVRGIASGMGDGETSQDTGLFARVVGLLGERVVLTVDSGDRGAFVTDLQRPPVRIPGLASAGGVSPTTGQVSGQVVGDTSTAVVVDPDTGAVAWRAEHTVLQGFSPDGRHVLGLVDHGSGFCCQAVYDAATGHPVTDVEGILNRIGATSVPVTWEDDRHLLAGVFDGRRVVLVRIGLDGSLERAGTPVPASEQFVLAATP
ncbi:hypothetical protein FB382_000418 [Nocardioides ginsengisegetis]|uniref:PQQ-like domain-containing protein n=1 Tax=Nocardioides ginsengisegetis TaxID=661491 RepID=A0A7W3IWU4_9ACTN|nr:hypothetical protein [Nocardioides ginsengisegetis]MBA8802127.1 hypothetical protein [Nocardioides ginsengisegetis]